ncbi:MAG: ferrochelatase [Actinobacteria bacterium]|nr:MAG: ferrochelatase [Actinomycetota bacterium]
MALPVTSEQPIGILVMAYGTAAGVEDIERYYTDIRGGRPPSPEHLAELRSRYAAIGDRFPLLEITRAQSAGLEAALNRVEVGRFRCYLGMKHSPPWIADSVAQMRADGIERGVGIVMAPHWSAMSIPTYAERVEAAVAANGGPAFSFVRSYHDHPALIELLADRVRAALEDLPADTREGATVVFSAHSLPVRTEEDGSDRCLRCHDAVCAAGCRYDAGLHETADLVARVAAVDRYTTAWQSAGRTADPWWGPPIEGLIRDLGEGGASAVVVCSVGFVADHLEILFDLDIEARTLAEEQGMAFARTEMPNADTAFTAMLADVVHRHLAEREAAIP